MRKKVQADVPTDTRFLDADNCAARYGFSSRHWQRLVDLGKAPQPTRFGRLCRWPIAKLEEWELSGCPRCLGGRS